jgi:hydrogenase nickel incorporation protein HypA/HybF
LHELSLAEGLVDLVAERTTGRQVVAVNLRVGDRSGVVADALAFCFDVVTVETPLAGAVLHIEAVEGEDLSVASVEMLRQEAQPCA